MLTTLKDIDMSGSEPSAQTELKFDHLGMENERENLQVDTLISLGTENFRGHNRTKV